MKSKVTTDRIARSNTMITEMYVTITKRLILIPSPILQVSTKNIVQKRNKLEFKIKVEN